MMFVLEMPGRFDIEHFKNQIFTKRCLIRICILTKICQKCVNGWGWEWKVWNLNIDLAFIIQVLGSHVGKKVCKVGGING